VSAPARPRNAHTCPGCKARQVPRHQLACRSCWYRLPYGIRQEVNAAYRDRENGTGRHHAALRDALDWYRDHPKET
jgi:hypothetical protein